MFRPGPGVRLFAAGLLIAGVFAFQVGGQTKDKQKDGAKKDGAKKDGAKGTFKPDIKDKAVQGKISKDVIEEQKKKAVPYKPFQMRDPTKPKTDKNVVKADTKLPALPNGKVLTAKQYFEELSKQEKGFTKIGYTLRAKSTNPVQIARIKQDTKVQEQRVKELKAKIAKYDPTKHKTQFKKREQQASLYKARLKDDKKRATEVKKFLDKKYPAKGGTPAKEKDKGKGAVGRAPVFTPQGTSKQWKWMLGRKNILAGELQINLDAKGSDKGVNINGRGVLGAYLVNNYISVLNANGNFNVPRQGKSRANINVYVFGNRIYNLDKEVTTNYTFTHTVQKSLEKSATFRAMIGPVPVAARVGIQGTVGVRFFVGLSPLYCNAQVVPFANVKAYAQAGVDIVIAGAGAGGQLTLFNAELRVGGTMAIKFDKKRGAFLTENVYVYGNMNMLSGSLYLYLESYVPRWGIPPWTKKRWTFDLWKWAGVNHGGYLVNVSKEHDIPG